MKMASAKRFRKAFYTHIEPLTRYPAEGAKPVVVSFFLKIFTQDANSPDSSRQHTSV